MFILVNKFLPGYAVGQIVKVPDDGKTPPVPKDPFWRRRLKDAKSDGCCEIYNPLLSSKQGDNK